MNLNDVIKKSVDSFEDLRGTHANESAVGLLLTEINGEVSVVFERRALRLHTQPGEVCLPGGKCDKNELPEETVVREIREEINIEAKVIKQIGVERHYLGYKVNVFLVTADSLDGMRTDPNEVSDVFTVPLEYFLKNPAQKCDYKMSIDESSCCSAILPFTANYERTISSPIWFYDGKVIWGMTARIIQNFTSKI